MTYILLTLLMLASIVMCIITSVAYFKKGMWVISPPAVLILYFVSAMMFGVIQDSVNSQTLRGLAAHSVWFLGMAAGVVAVKGMSRRNLSIAGPAQVVGWGGFEGSKGLFYAFIWFGIICVVVTFLIFGRVPLLIGLKSLFGATESIGMHEARQMNTLSHRAGDTVYFGQGYLRNIYTVVSPIFCGALYLLAISRRPHRSPVMEWSLFALFVLFGALNGQIWVGLEVWIYFIFVLVFARVWRSEGREVVPLITKGAKLYLAILVFVFSYRYLQVLGGRAIQNGWFENTVNRIWGYDQIRLFQIFPDLQPYRLGSTWLGDLAGVLPGASQSFAYESHYLIHGGAWGFTASPGIVASAYLNFGYLGVFFTALVFTIVFCKMFAVLIASRSALRIALGIALSVRFAFGLPGDFVPYLVDLTTIATIFFAYIFSNSLRRQLARAV